jgi:6-phosphogluconolactonase
MSKTAQTVLYSFPGVEELTDALAAYITKIQREAVNKKGRFTIAISGGSLPKTLHGLIGRPGVTWDKWHVYYADERVVPLDHEESNHGLCVRELYSHLGGALPANQIFHLNPDLLDDIEELTDDYESKLITEFANKDSARFPVFDLILLGVAPDGHTASMFPGHSLLTEASRWVVYVEDSPKPPPKRVTITLPVMNHASHVAFVVTGVEKQKILKDVLDHPELGLPGSRVKPVLPGKLAWFVDDAASKFVEHERTLFGIHT